jgi:AbrB family looped-hinge helix DNA binding protein
MTVTLKTKSEIIVPKSIRRQAGIRPGDRLEFTVSGSVINIRPRLSPDETQDECEIRDPRIRAAIRASHEEFVAGKTRPAKDFFRDRAVRAKKS